MQLANKINNLIKLLRKGGKGNAHCSTMARPSTQIKEKANKQSQIIASWAGKHTTASLPLSK